MVCPLPGGSWTAFDRTPVLEITGLDGEPMHFWAKTTPDGQPGISVRDRKRWSLASRPPKRLKIGRASCRERV